VPAKRLPSRLRRFLLLHLPLSVAGIGVLLVAVLGGLYLWMSSTGFEELVRKRLIATIEESTGGRVEIAHFHWRLLTLEAEADGLVLHGTEDAGEEPLATAERMVVRLSILDFFSPHILVRSFDLARPTVHSIVYQDGSTNLPTPQRKQRAGSSSLDKLFEFHAGRISVYGGMVRTENRASSFDFQNRYQPVEFGADDLSFALFYVPGSRGVREKYRIEAGATDINMTRSGVHVKYPPVHGYFQASLELERNAARLRSLRITARGHDRVERSLEISGALSDFAHPRWQAQMHGELDMRLVSRSQAIRIHLRVC
jgi:translocation and assembly module TamB